MKIKKFAALFIAFLMLFLMTACNENENEKNPQEKVTEEVTEDVVNTPSDSVTDETVTEAESEVEDETTTGSEKEESTEEKTEKSSSSLTEKASDISEWSKKQIADFYKRAAKKSDSKVKSEQKIVLKDISVNNGQFEGFFDFIMPIMSKLLEKNSKSFDGITGGYNNLTESDISSSKVYKSGKNTVVEMVMKKQISGPSDNALEGSVGHAISAVGDIGAVVKQLTDLGLPLELSDKDTKIHYTNPTVRVVINENGEIVKGTWKYTVEIRMDNYKAFGKPVENTSVVMDNTITVNGGF